MLKRKYLGRRRFLKARLLPKLVKVVPTETEGVIRAFGYSLKEVHRADIITLSKKEYKIIEQK